MSKCRKSAKEGDASSLMHPEIGATAPRQTSCRTTGEGSAHAKSGGEADGPERERLCTVVRLSSWMRSRVDNSKAKAAAPNDEEDKPVLAGRFNDGRLPESTESSIKATASNQTELRIGSALSMWARSGANREASKQEPPNSAVGASRCAELRAGNDAPGDPQSKVSSTGPVPTQENGEGKEPRQAVARRDADAPNMTASEAESNGSIRQRPDKSIWGSGCEKDRTERKGPTGWQSGTGRSVPKQTGPHTGRTRPIHEEARGSVNRSNCRRSKNETNASVQDTLNTGAATSMQEKLLTSKTGPGCAKSTGSAARPAQARLRSDGKVSACAASGASADASQRLGPNSEKGKPGFEKP